MDDKTRTGRRQNVDPRKFMEAATRVIGAGSIFSVAVFQGVGNVAEAEEAVSPTDLADCGNVDPGESLVLPDDR